MTVCAIACLGVRASHTRLDIAAGKLLTRAISELRRVLGDHANQPHIIATVARSGYRIIAPVEPVVTRSGPPLCRQSAEFQLKSEQAYAPEKLLETLIGAVPVECWVDG